MIPSNVARWLAAIYQFLAIYMETAAAIVMEVAHRIVSRIIEFLDWLDKKRGKEKF